MSIQAQIRFSAVSSKGRGRRQNDDRVRVLADRQIYVVADGIGSHSVGGQVAESVVEILPDRLLPVLGDSSQQFDEMAIARVMEETVALSHEIHDRRYGMPGSHGSGATVLLAAIRGDRVLFIHLGDSRAYRLRGSVLEQVTADHTVGQILQSCNKSQVDEVDVEGMDRLTRYIGMAGHVLVEAKMISLEVGDLLLLCTDGLSSVVSEEKIREILAQRMEPEATCQELVRSADAAGSPDNVTVIVISVDGKEGSPGVSPSALEMGE